MHPLGLKIGFLALTLGVVGVLFVAFTNKHWWRKLSTAQVIYDGRRVPDADVYRSPNGEIFLDTRGLPEDGLWYVIFPKENRVGIPSTSQFYFLPGYAYSRNDPPYVVFMDSKVKWGREHEPELQVTPDSVNFLSRGRRIQILIN